MENGKNTLKVEQVFKKRRDEVRAALPLRTDAPEDRSIYGIFYQMQMKRSGAEISQADVERRIEYYGSRLKAAKFEVKVKANYRAHEEVTWNYGTQWG